MRRTLAALLAATSLSIACELPPMGPQPHERADRIAWRAQLGIEAAHRYVFSDCVNDLASDMNEHAHRYGISARDLAESIVWGAYHHMERLPAGEEPDLSGYLNALIDEHGERIVEVVDVLYGSGAHESTFHWLYASAIENALNTETSNQLRGRIATGLMLARMFGHDPDALYERIRASF